MNSSKTPGNSLTITTEVVCPNDVNPMGILLGGRLVQWMDISAAICAQNHAEQVCVTASIDTVSFKAPAKVGDMVTIKARVTRAFKSSMEILTQAWSKKVTSSESTLINEAYFTFVAINAEGKPAKVPVIIPETAEEKKEFEKAEKRRAQRLKDE